VLKKRTGRLGGIVSIKFSSYLWLVNTGYQSLSGWGIGKIRPNRPKDGFFAQNSLKKPSRRRNRLAELASKAFVMVILNAKVYLYYEKDAFSMEFWQWAKKRPGQPTADSGRTDQAPSRDGFAVKLTAEAVEPSDLFDSPEPASRYPTERESGSWCS